jgi:hypothetical protein
MIHSALSAQRPGGPGSRYRFAAPMENLEQRLMWSVSFDANGWTVVTPSSNENIIYVSSATGKDTNSGLSQSAPVYSFKKAESLLQNGKPNEILLQAGDTYNDAFLNWVYSGADIQDPILVSYYGTGTRPLIDSGTNPSGFATPINQPYNNAAVNYVDIIGLQFQANFANPASPAYNASAGGAGNGFYFENPGSNILLEDDSFEYYRYNMNVEGVEGPVSNITIRRCVDDYAYGASYSHSQGLYAYNVSNLIIFQSVFDHDGWSSLVSTAEDLGFNHDVYIASTCSGIDIEQSIFAEAAFAGIMARAGGTINNNLFIDDAIAVAYGQANGADSTVGGVTGTLSGNVMVGDKGYDDGQVYGQGFDIGNIEPVAGLTVANNIITDDTENAKPAIQLDPATGTTNPTQAVGENNVTLENNITNGFREGIETDGRFQDGVSPATATLYAYNNVTYKNNTFLNATAYEINHPNTFDSATEFWSGNDYYDSVLSQSSWISVANTGVPFSTWISSYDTGAKQLPSLSQFPNPNVTIASYDATLGGPGTWQDFLTNADQLSIQNYQTQYMALAAINYIQAGFGVPLTTANGSSGATGASGPPSASAQTLNLNNSQIGTTTYTFSVNYTDANLLKSASLGGGNLLVTGPNGFSQYAAYVSSAPSTTDSSGYQHVAATYVITAPNGEWVKGEDGTYTITMQANQVFDSFGNAVPDGSIGTFYADFTSPTAVASAANINSTTQGSSAFNFTIAYSSAVGIDTTTLDNFSVKVTGPSNYSRFASVSGFTTTGNTTLVTYSVAAPGSSWTAGTYTINLTAGTVSDMDGNSVVGGALASFVSQAGSTTANGTSSLGGVVFNDANGDGILDDRESTFTGVTVFIDLAGTGVYTTGDPKTTTSSTGSYSFTGLLAGQYTVIEQPPTGFVVTSPSTGSNVVTLTTGQPVTGVNFANQLKTAVVSSTGGSSSGGGSSNSSSGGTSNISGGATINKNAASGILSTVSSGSPVSGSPISGSPSSGSPSSISPVSATANPSGTLSASKISSAVKSSVIPAPVPTPAPSKTGPSKSSD